jgi:Rrf2 family protein
VALAKLPEGAYAGAVRIAQEIGAPLNYLGKLPKALNEKGLTQSQEGPGGGLRLACGPQDISLFDVLEPTEHLGRWSACILRSPVCSEAAPCAIHRRWKTVRGKRRPLRRRLRQVPAGTGTDSECRRGLGVFFRMFWVCATSRPNQDSIYTQSWPHEPLIDNTPTVDAVLWSVLSFVLLLARIGCRVWYFAAHPGGESEVV